MSTLKQIGQAIKRVARQGAARLRAKAAARKPKLMRHRLVRFTAGPPRPNPHYRQAKQRRKSGHHTTRRNGPRKQRTS